MEAAEAQAARATADADRAASQGRHVDAGRAKEAAGRIEGKIAGLPRRARRREPSRGTRGGAAGGRRGALCLALVKALAPKLADAAVNAAGPTAEVGADAARSEGTRGLWPCASRRFEGSDRASGRVRG